MFTDRNFCIFLFSTFNIFLFLELQELDIILNHLVYTLGFKIIIYNIQYLYETQHLVNQASYEL